MRWSTKKKYQRFLPLVFVFIIISLFILYLSNRDGRSDIYKYQKNYKKYDKDSITYKFGIISDKDKNSKKVKDGKNTLWHSIFKRGILTRVDDDRYEITWDEEVELNSLYSEEGRGMELSELIYWKGDLLSCDDRSGIIYKITEHHKVIPTYVLTRGDGINDRGFKCEWMSVKDDKLYIGSIGKEWTDGSGNIIDAKVNMYIKTIDQKNTISHIDWTDNYNKLREQLGVLHPGYMIHEAVNWNPVTKEWYFLPRRVSKEVYNEQQDERRGANVIIVANENFSKFNVARIGDIIPERGFSSFKFIPGRENEIIALKSVEDGNNILTYMTIFDHNTGKILLHDTKVGDDKFEGVEIL